MFGEIMKKINLYMLVVGAAVTMTFTSCDKVSPTGVLMAGTGVDDRVQMSIQYYTETFSSIGETILGDEEYSFLVAADSHLTTDTMRLHEMFQIALDEGDLFVAHLGDIADTKAEYYKLLKEVVDNYYNNYFYKKVAPYFVYDESIDMWRDREIPDLVYTKEKLIEHYVFPFFPVVGNHDITHNGWALWCDLFKTSFYEFDIVVGNNAGKDHFIFLDTASGTLGEKQIEAINKGMLDFQETDAESDVRPNARNTFLFSHTNLFRPNTVQFASTFPREEMYYIFDCLERWNVSGMFCGHVHAWDDRYIGDVRYITLDSMSERNSPEPGDYLVRVKVHKDGSWDIEKVHMSYSTNAKGK